MWTQWLVRIQVFCFLVVLIFASLMKFLGLATLVFFLGLMLSVLLIELLGAVGLVALLLSFPMTKPRWRKHSVIAVVAATIPVLLIFSLIGPEGFSKPVIHDISTDLENPPQFVAAVAERRAGDNSLEYEGDAVAQQQRSAYPNIQPLLVPTAPSQAFANAVSAIEALGWTFLSKDAQTGVIEAYDQTAVLGFVDDVVVRIQPWDGGSRVDVRSVSRIGRGDFGANAARILLLQERIKKQ